MRHIFIINPVAGKGNLAHSLDIHINQTAARLGLTYEIYNTKCAGDAAGYVRQRCVAATEQLRFYACGGDGTLNEVVNGAVGFENIEVASVPCGSGNDFVRNFPAAAAHFNLEKLIKAPAHLLDLLCLNGQSYGVNMCNVGFDAAVALNMTRFKALPLVSGHMAYYFSLLYSLLQRMFSRLHIVVDDEKLAEQDFLLSAVGNGCFCGGGFKGLPLAQVNDGLMDLCAVKKVSRFKLLAFVSAYKAGTHLQNEKIKPYIFYRQCGRVEISSEKPFAISIDGENARVTHLVVELQKNAIAFVVPPL